MVSAGNALCVRRIQPKDAEDVSNIYVSITQHTVNDKIHRLIKEHVCNGENDACIVAELHGRIVGFMFSYILPFSFGTEKSAWIATMGVDPKHMGQGIGARLAEEILKIYRSKGVSNVHTSVCWDATDVLSFFKILGFDRSDFINLKKPLN